VKNKRVDTYSHYNKDDKKLDKKIKEVKDEESSFKVEGRNSVIELLKSNREVNKVLIAKGERQGSINDIIIYCKERCMLYQKVEKQSGIKLLRQIITIM